MTAFELAKKYYPTLWPLARLDALLEAGKITRAEYDMIVSNSDTGEGSA